MRKDKYFPYLLILPFLILLIVFRLIPMIMTVYRSFYTFDNGIYNFIKLTNFQKMLNDQLLFKSVANTLLIFIFFMIVKVPFLLIVSHQIFKMKKTKKLYLSILYLPTLIGIFAFAIIYRYLFTYDGIVNDLLFKLFRYKIPWLEVGTNAKFVFAFAMTWSSFGISTLLLVNAYDSVPKEILESASIDGAGSFRKLIHIMLPYASRVIGFIILTGFIASLNLLDLPFNLTQGAPNNETLTVGFYVYKVAFSYNDFSYASTIGFAIFTIIGCVYIVYRKILKTYAKNI